ncbi:MAG: para-aminobenzoate synthetase component [Actinomycetota bacterium]|nr:para-aminobenzoate synthetase component [Actinomycetota bacterium]
MDGFDPAICAPPGHPGGPLRELERLEWRSGDDPDGGALLLDFLSGHGLAGEPGTQKGDISVVLLLGAVGCAVLAGLPGGPVSPVPAVPDLVAVAVRGEATWPTLGRPVLGEWRTSWADAEHAAAVEEVRAAIARGDVYQANVVGHRSAPHQSSPAEVAAAVAGIGAAYAGVLTGEGWAVGSASPEQLVRVDGRRITTEPIKGTRRVGPGTFDELRASEKDRAEHVMIVDLERNDLARLAVTGSVEVETLYDVSEWSGLWHASSTVAAELEAGVGFVDVLRAVAPGGSVTGAPKRAACALLAELEPIGRGPAMGAFGIVRPGGMDLGLTIRTVAADADRVHLWAGGGITWGSDAADEVAEAHAKAGPVMAALAAGAT